MISIAWVPFKRTLKSKVPQKRPHTSIHDHPPLERRVEGRPRTLVCVDEFKCFSVGVCCALVVMERERARERERERERERGMLCRLSLFFFSFLLPLSLSLLSPLSLLCSLSVSSLGSRWQVSSRQEHQPSHVALAARLA